MVVEPQENQETQREPQPLEAPPPALRRRGPGRPRRRGCPICADRVKVIDYKDVGRLRRFLSDRGRMEPRRRVNTCAKHHRALSRAIKRARHLALLPYTQEHIRQTGFGATRS